MCFMLKEIILKILWFFDEMLIRYRIFCEKKRGIIEDIRFGVSLKIL